MSRKFRQLRHMNNQLEKNLNEENQKTLTDIVVYLRGSNISEYQQEIIRKDITDMMIDGELRNMTMHEVVGDSYKEFCDNIIAEIPQQKPLEKVLSILGNMCLYSCVVIIIWLITSLFELFYQNTFPILTLRLGDLMSYVILICVSICIVEYICKNSFETESVKLLSKSHLKPFLILVVWVILFILSRLYLNHIIFYVQFYSVLIVILSLYMAYKLFDELCH